MAKTPTADDIFGQAGREMQTGDVRFMIDLIKRGNAENFKDELNVIKKLIEEFNEELAAITAAVNKFEKGDKSNEVRISLQENTGHLCKGIIAIGRYMELFINERKPFKLNIGAQGGNL